ncbi:putative ACETYLTRANSFERASE [Vibrio nigripulchritudo SO65]|uniref:acyltransferase family protein n=1 Tax=Vibrio nigripulchritudo TaxID=28173 RepID=UPI0003B1D85F|nr:acyltransferase [Vibrio nigripulchritudo]CCN36563.1 putative ACETYLTRANSFERASE [Vibrio nigripulchritudo AM115]CCN43623.1 putative ACETYLTRANSFERASE [Vibrio nigripulchritudo FTn2]CCN65344.1 putative ACETYLTRANSFERASE [Vibrio nigripulchritudo POn4]CCN77702.1 putative ACETYLTRANSFERASE [Vibrio nigripulchritudo SO65]
MKTRFYEIDLLRFLSAIFVVIFHYTYSAHMAGHAPVIDLENTRIWSRYAYMGINFFFVISGFVIFMSVEGGSARKFVASRFSRLFPAYWVALALTSIVTVYFGAPKFTVDGAQFLANLTMVNHWFGHMPVDGAYWTLFLEVKFYLLVFALLILRMMKYFLHVIAIVLIVSTATLFHPWAKEMNMWVSIFPHWSGYFAAGGVFYFIRRDGIRRDGASAFKMLLLALSFVYMVKQSTLFGELMSGWFSITFNTTVIAILNIAFFMLFCVTAFCKENILRQKWLYYLGVLTYPIYLVHQNIGYIIFNHFGDSVDPVVLVTSTIALMLVVAYVIHTQVERRLAPLFKTAMLRLLRIPDEGKSRKVAETVQ